MAHALYAVSCLLQLDRLSDARKEALKGWELGRNNATKIALALTDYCARDYARAILHAQAMLQGQPEADPIGGILIDCYLAERKWDDAWFFIEKNGVDLDGYRALIRALKGDREEALRVAKRRDATGADPLANAARQLESADRRHEFYARIFARYSAEFDEARGSPAFAAVLEAMRHPRQH